MLHPSTVLLGALALAIAPTLAAPYEWLQAGEPGTLVRRAGIPWRRRFPYHRSYEAPHQVTGVTKDGSSSGERPPVVKPIEPIEPGKPIEPGMPIEPDESDKSDKSGQSGQSGQSGKTDKTDKPRSRLRRRGEGFVSTRGIDQID